MRASTDEHHGRNRHRARIRARATLLLCAALGGCSDDGSPADAATMRDAGDGRDAASAAGRDAAPAGGRDGATSGDAGGAGRGGAGTAGAGMTDGGGAGQGGSGAQVGCFAAGERPASVEPAGFAMPDLAAERAAYERRGLGWSPDAEPDAPADPDYAVADPDIHGDTEGDDLWTNLMMSLRTGQAGYADRARAWARYFEEDYRSCVGDPSRSFCYDRDAYGADHLWGHGLIAWASAEDDADALAEAGLLGEAVEALWADDSAFGCLPAGACTWYGVRQVGRHLLFVTRLAEVTGNARWVALRDRILDLLLSSDDWDAGEGMYFYGDWGTDEALGAGAYAAGARIQSSFQIGVLGEALDHAYRVTGREEIRERLVAMARFVERRGLDATYDYTASTFGIVDGETWHSYSGAEPVEFWDPVYTTSLVNTLVRGYLYTCEEHFRDSAWHFFERGNAGLYGEPTMTAVPAGTVHHFVDSVFASVSADLYFDYNKGELQYTYLLFQALE